MKPRRLYKVVSSSISAIDRSVRTRPSTAWSCAWNFSSERRVGRAGSLDSALRAVASSASIAAMLNSIASSLALAFEVAGEDHDSRLAIAFMTQISFVSLQARVNRAVTAYQGSKERQAGASPTEGSGKGCVRL